MEKDAINACIIQAKKVAQDVLIFVWSKNDVFTDEQKQVTTGIKSPVSFFADEMPAEFVKNLRTSVWIETSRLEYALGNFMRKYYARITKTPFLFTNYFAYVGYLLIDQTPDAHACFHDILSLVIHFALFCWQQDNKTFLNACSELFCAFFDKELSTRLESQGRWKNFNEYVINREDFRKFRELVDNDKSSFELFKEFAERPKQTVINGFSLEDITDIQVENDKRSVMFANLVEKEMKDVCGKSFDYVLEDFIKTDNQLNELYLEVTEETSSKKAGAEDQSFSDVPEETPDNTCQIADEKIEDGKKQDEDRRNETNPLTTQNIIPIQVGNRSSDPWKPENVKKAKELLKEMIEDIVKISELLKYVCEDNGVTDPVSKTANR